MAESGETVQADAEETLRTGNVTFIPSIHQRMVFADEVRRAAVAIRPDCIAVELPPALREPLIRGVLGLPALSTVCYIDPGDPGHMLHVPVDPCDSLIEGVRTAVAHDIEIEFVDPAPAGYITSGTPLSEAVHKLPDDFMIERTGLARYVATVVPYLREYPVSEEEAARESGMALRLAHLSRRHERILCVLGLAHFHGVRRRLEELLGSPGLPDPGSDDDRGYAGAFLARVSERSIPEVLREIPWLAARRESIREEQALSGDFAFEKTDALVDALRIAADSHREEFKVEISPMAFAALLQYLRNLAIARGNLQPGAWETVTAAQSVVDGDYGWLVGRMLDSYETGAEGASDLPELNVRKGRATLSDRERRYRLSPRFPRPPFTWKKMKYRLRPPPEMMAIWAREWGEGESDPRGICSWPPEDETQEKFMADLRDRSLRLISSEKRQVTEFTTSFEDGLDLRETMRNWHTGKFYVRSEPQVQGRVGAVVLILDKPEADPLYDWRCTLYAENSNESDISFYATRPGAQVVGPRISRTEFGGLLSVFPANHIPDIWSFPDVRHLSSCAQVLLAAAILFSESRFISYVAERPPSGFMRELASRYKRRIIHLPLRTIPAPQLRRIRKFHILNGHDVRNYAADYIFD